MYVRRGVRVVWKPFRGRAVGAGATQRDNAPYIMTGRGACYGQEVIPPEQQLPSVPRERGKS